MDRITVVCSSNARCHADTSNGLINMKSISPLVQEMRAVSDNIGSLSREQLWTLQRTLKQLQSSVKEALAEIDKKGVEISYPFVFTSGKVYTIHGVSYDLDSVHSYTAFSESYVDHMIKTKILRKIV